VEQGPGDAGGELRERVLSRWPAGRRLPEFVDGPTAPIRLAELDADVVLNAVSGDQGLPATLAAPATGARVALANKESLIAGGSVGVAGRGARATRPGRLRAPAPHSVCGPAA
jgi:hypothetical protein